jgi:predicted NBD/HSP70 family sugar kinase
VIRDVRRRNTGGLQSLVGAPAVRALLGSHGLRGGSSAAILARASATFSRGVVTDPAYERAAGALRELGTRLATGLAAIVSVLDPELIVLAGDAVRAGGEPLRGLVERELHSLTIPQPPLRLSSVSGNPVLAGALHLGLTDARDELFSSTVPLSQPSRRRS